MNGLLRTGESTAEDSIGTPPSCQQLAFQVSIERVLKYVNRSVMMRIFLP